MQHCYLNHQHCQLIINFGTDIINRSFSGKNSIKFSNLIDGNKFFYFFGFFYHILFLKYLILGCVSFSKKYNDDLDLQFQLLNKIGISFINVNTK